MLPGCQKSTEKAGTTAQAFKTLVQLLARLAARECLVPSPSSFLPGENSDDTELPFSPNDKG